VIGRGSLQRVNLHRKHEGPGNSGFASACRGWSFSGAACQSAGKIRSPQAARKDGTLALLQRGAPVPVKSSEPPKSRQQVIDEMRAESPDARRARLELLTGG